MACLLGRLPLRIALVDQAEQDSSAIPFSSDSLKFDSRVSALTKASTRLFDKIGAWERICSMRCCAYQDMEVWDADGTGRIPFLRYP